MEIKVRSWRPVPVLKEENMPLAGSDAALKTLIKTAFQQATASYESGDSDAYLDTLCDGIAKAVINHIVANAQVQTTVTGTCSTGPIAGTGTGKIL